MPPKASTTMSTSGKATQRRVLIGDRRRQTARNPSARATRQLMRPAPRPQRQSLGAGGLGRSSATVSATVGTIALASVGHTSRAGFWGAWSVWWTGDAMGVLVVAPFLLTLRGLRPRRAVNWPRWAGASVVLAGTGLVAFAVLHSRLRLEYLVFPLLGWAAWRFGQRGAGPAALLTSTIAIWAAVDGVAGKRSRCIG